MGTNYYVKTETCSHCGHKPEPLHIGKMSAGWEFSFHATETIRSFADWREYLKDKVIENEYGCEVPYDQFVKMVEDSKGQMNHTAYCRKHHPDYKDCFLDPEGWSMTDGEFS